LKRLAWIASSRKDLKSFPESVRGTFGFALYEAQLGGMPDDAKPLKGFGGAGVLEVIANDDGSTYRAVFTVRFAELIFVLHCFQKKSKSGIATPKQDIDLVKARLKLAEQEYMAWKKK
jgi:phage-related protein